MSNDDTSVVDYFYNLAYIYFSSVTCRDVNVYQPGLVSLVKKSRHMLYMHALALIREIICSVDWQEAASSNQYCQFCVFERF